MAAYDKSAHWAAIRLKALEKRKRALELRMQGLTYREIGAAMGCSTNQACAMVSKIIKDRAAEIDDLVRQQSDLSLMRLDSMVKALWPKASAGDTDAVQALIRVEERRSKLLGLDAPQRIQADVDLHSLPESEIFAMAERIGIQVVAVANGEGTAPLMLPVAPAASEAAPTRD